MTSSIDSQDVERFQAAITTHTGLVFDGSAGRGLGEILEERLRANRSRNVDEYLRDLESSRREAMEVGEFLTVSETYFLRNSDQFSVVQSWLNERAEQSDRCLRILSAGCSSGDEPYSLAIVLRETIPDLDRWNASICGVDLSSGMLEKARAASYSAWSLRETPAHLRQRYFRLRERRYILDDSIRSMVEFAQQNLLDPGSGCWQSELYDIVFCRNVLMYLALDAARSVVANIARSMKAGGLLFLGHAENLRGLSQDFHLRHSHGTFHYERHRSAGTNAPREKSLAQPVCDNGARPAWFDSIERSSAKIVKLTEGAGTTVSSETQTTGLPGAVEAGRSLAPAIALLSSERFTEALQLIGSLPRSSADDPDALLLKAILLTSSGNPQAAEAVCRRLLVVDELNAGAHYVMALCQEYAGNLSAAQHHDRTAAHLDPAFAMPRLHLGLLLRRDHDHLAARRELKAALGLLSREDPARIVLFSGGFGREGLIELCRGELDACADVM